VPLGALAFVLGRRALPRLAAPGAVGGLDGLGAILGPAGFAALTFGISQSTSAGWTGPTTLAGIGLGVLALVAFATRELLTATPLLDLRVFRSRVFVQAILTQ
jgi:hypothetical protein